MATAKKPASKTPAKPVKAAEPTKEELLKKLATLREEAVALKRGTREGSVQNVRAYSQKRRELARVLTALNRPAEGEEK